jgi:hypothetical protein
MGPEQVLSNSLNWHACSEPAELWVSLWVFQPADCGIRLLPAEGEMAEAARPSSTRPQAEACEQGRVDPGMFGCCRFRPVFTERSSTRSRLPLGSDNRYAARRGTRSALKGHRFPTRASGRLSNRSQRQLQDQLWRTEDGERPAIDCPRSNDDRRPQGPKGTRKVRLEFEDCQESGEAPDTGS